MIKLYMMHLLNDSGSMRIVTMFGLTYNVTSGIKISKLILSYILTNYFFNFHHLNKIFPLYFIHSLVWKREERERDSG